MTGGGRNPADRPRLPYALLLGSGAFYLLAALAYSRPILSRILSESESISIGTLNAGRIDLLMISLGFFVLAEAMRRSQLFAEILGRRWAAPALVALVIAVLVCSFLGVVLRHL